MSKPRSLLLGLLAGSAVVTVIGAAPAAPPAIRARATSAA